MDVWVNISLRWLNAKLTRKSGFPHGGHMAKHRSNWISASEVGRARFCAHALELKYSGAAVSASAEKARERGDAAHERFNTQMRESQRDSRCFIASHAYGLQDPRTEMLRQWRDEVLMPTATGRVFVKLYYLVSPALVRACRRISILDRGVRLVLDTFHGHIFATQEDRDV